MGTTVPPVPPEPPSPLLEMESQPSENVWQRLDRLRDILRPVFHYKWSSLVLPLLFSLGVGMVLADHFTLPYWCFAGAGLWGILFWLTGDRLRSQRRLLRRRSTRRDPAFLVSQTRKYCALEWGVVVAILAVSIMCIGWTRSVEFHNHLQNVKDNISIEYSIPAGFGNDPSKSVVTVTNGGLFEISAKHRIVCSFVQIVGAGGTAQVIGGSFVQNGKQWMLLGRGEEKDRFFPPSAPLQPNGDGQTDEACMGAVRVVKPDCADMIIEFQYYLTEQPNTFQDKPVRIVTYENGDGTFTWHKQPLDRQISYCASYVKQR